MADKLVLYLYKYVGSQFVLQSAIDDYEEISWESRLYEAGTFTIQINYNIPNASLFKKGLYIQMGNDPYKFGEINNIENSLSSTGKGSQYIAITGYDARYLFHKRIIKEKQDIEINHYKIYLIINLNILTNPKWKVQHPL